MLSGLPERPRAFVALRMDPAIEAAVVSLIQEMRSPGDGVGWTRGANLHLTLRFLGDAVPAIMLDPLDSALREIGESTYAFRVRAGGTGAFPNSDRPRVLWIGLDGAPLSGLARRVEAAARECGFAPETRPFVPHLTIGRVRHLRARRRLQERLAEHALDQFGDSMIETMILYRSTPGPEGSIYEPIAQYPLRRSA